MAAGAEITAERFALRRATRRAVLGVRRPGLEALAATAQHPSQPRRGSPAARKGTSVAADPCLDGASTEAGDACDVDVAPACGAQAHDALDAHGQASCPRFSDLSRCLLTVLRNRLTMPSMLKPEDVERLRVEAMIDERTMYRLTTGQSVRGDVRRRVERAAKRLSIVLPRGLFAHAADDTAA